MSVQSEKEGNWADGFHVSTNGRRTDLSDIDTNHLQNMIRKYGAMGYDTSALETELNKRS